MSLYKRFRGHEPSPEALLKSGTTINHDTILFQNRGSNVSVFFYQKKTTISHQKNRNAFDPKGSIIAGSFSLAK
jgi:ribonuclease HIII